MRTLSSLMFAAVAAVPLFTLMPSSNAEAQVVRRDSSSDIGNYGYRDNSGYRSRSQSRELTRRGISRGDGYTYGANRWDGRRGYGYSSYGYRPVSYGYTSYGYAPRYGYTSYGYGAGDCDCAPKARRVARHSYGYAPVAVAPVARVVRSYSYAPVAYSYDDDDDAYGYSSYGYRSYGYGSYGRGYGYGPGLSVGFSW